MLMIGQLSGMFLGTAVFGGGVDINGSIKIKHYIIILFRIDASTRLALSTMEHVQTLAERLDDIRNSPLDKLQEEVIQLDLVNRMPTTFLDSLSDKDRAICLRAS